MQVRTTARLTPDGGAAETLVNRVITIGAENESFVVMPVDMKQLPGKRAVPRVEGEGTLRQQRCGTDPSGSRDSPDWLPAPRAERQN